eukprot:SAG22_NODE_188_length_15821_cov_38.313319_6_plen_132_part_00
MAGFRPFACAICCGRPMLEARLPGQQPVSHRAVTHTESLTCLRAAVVPPAGAAQAVAIFKWYGHTDKMLLPYDLFARRLFGGDAKANSKQGCQMGAYAWDQPQTWGWDGALPVSPPQDCNPGHRLLLCLGC